MKIRRKESYKNYVKNVVLPVLVYGALTGLVVGTVVFFFKWVAEWLTETSIEIYRKAQSNPWIAVAVFAAVIALAFIAWLLQRWAPETKGGGIPRAEGVLRGILTFRWLRTGIAVLVNSWISFFAGLPLGSEGPSVLLGTAIGGGTCKLPLSHDSWDRYIMTGGACAGFAVATSAPVTGILFALEEAHKRFTPMIFLMAMSSVLFGVTASNLWAIGLHQVAPEHFHMPGPLFDITLANFEMPQIWIPLAAGVVIAFVACAYNLLVFIVGKLYDGKLCKVPHWTRLLIVFVLTAVIGVIAVGNFNGTDALFGGGGLIVKLSDYEKFTWGVIFALFVIRFFMIAFATGSGATGGVFIPMLSVGALSGALMGKLFVVMGMPQELYATVVILCMSSFMGAATRAPLTALVFTVECTWSFSNLLYVAVTVFVSYFICELVKVEPLYDVLLERMTEAQNRGKTAKIFKLEYTVSEKAFVVGKSVRDVLWPANTKVSGIVSGNSEKKMDDDGEKKVHAGDRVTVFGQTFDEEATQKELSDILGDEFVRFE